jgi:hypothetical protein
MGTRTNALVDHRVADPLRTETVVELLSPTVTDCRAVRDYWSSIEPGYGDTNESWTSRFHHNPPEEDFVWYEGPGGLRVRFGSRAAVVSALCRWRGFLSIEELQRVHANAFRSIARALGGTQVVLIPDDDEVEPMAKYDGAQLGDCVGVLRQRCGPPKRRTVLAEDDSSLASPACWKVWHVESLYNELPDASHQLTERAA